MTFSFRPRPVSPPLLCIDFKATRGSAWGEGRVRRYVRPSPLLPPQVVNEAQMPKDMTWSQIDLGSLEKFRMQGDF